MSEVAVIFTPQEAKLWRAQQKLIAQAMKLETGYKKVGRAARGTGNAAATSANKAGAASKALGGTLKSLAIQYVGVSASIQLINTALRETKELRKEALTTQVSVATAQVAALKNLSTLPTEEKLEAFEGAKRIQHEVGFPDIAELTKAVGEGFSASSDLAATMKAAEAAARLNILTPESVGKLTASALDVARGSKSKDAEANIGLLLAAGAEARVIDPEAMAENMAPLISSGVPSVPKQDPKEAAREIAVLFGILTREATDEMGRRTGTGGITFLTKMEEAFRVKTPGEIAKDEKKEQRELAKLSASERAEYLDLKARTTMPEDPGTIFGRVRALSESPELSRTFLGPEGFGERRNRGGVKLLLDPESDIHKSLDKLKDRVDFDADLFKRIEKETTSSTAPLRVAVSQARSKANIQQVEMDEGLGTEALKTEVLGKTLRKTRLAEPLAFVGERVNTALALTGMREEIDILQDQLEQLERPAPLGGTMGVAGAAAGRFAEMVTGDKLPITELQKAQIEAVKQQIALLEKQRDFVGKQPVNEPQTAAPAPAVIVPTEDTSDRSAQLDRRHDRRNDRLAQILGFALPKFLAPGEMLKKRQSPETGQPPEVDVRRERLESFAAMGEQPPVEVQPAPVQVQEAAQLPSPQLAPEQVPPVVQVAPPQVAITQEPQGREPAPIEGAPDKSLFDKFIGLALPKFLAPLAEQRKPAAVAQIPQPPQVEVTNDIRQGAPEQPAIQVQPAAAQVQNVVQPTIPHRVPEQAPPIVQVAPPELPEEQQVREPAQTKQEPARVEQQAPAGIDSKWEEFKREKEKARNRGEEALLQASTALERAAAALAANTGLQLQAPAQPTAAPRPSYSNDQRAQAVPA